MQRTRPEHARSERHLQAEHARPEHPRAEQARKNWLRLQHLRFTLEEETHPPAKRRIIFTFGLMAAGLLVTLAPVRVDRAALGGLVGAPGPSYVPLVCFLVGDLCLGAGMWAIIAAARSMPLERQMIAGLGIIAAALAGRCTRLVLQIVLLRRFYRPALFFTSPARAAAVSWGVLLTLILVAGFLGPLVVAAINLLPRMVTETWKPTRWLATRRRWLLLPFVSLPLTAIITQWVLSPPMAAAMGYTYPAPSGALLTVSLRDVGPAAWSSLQVLVALPLLVLMWEGVESARTCHRLVRNGTTDTRLLAFARRIDYRLAVAAVVIAVAGLAVARGGVLDIMAGAGLLLVIALTLRDRLGRAARLNRNFERGVRKWRLPTEWRDLGRVSLLLGVLAFPVLYILGADIFQGAKEGLWLPSDLHLFYYYWRQYGPVKIPDVSASGIFGHVEKVTWIVSMTIAGIMLVGIFLNFSRKEVRAAWPLVWFLLRVSALAFLLAPVARLADHSYATFALVAGAVAVIVVTFQRDRSAAVWSAVVSGGVLTVWSLAVLRATWVPAAAWVAFTIFQRFVWNAGELNEPGRFRTNKIAYFQAISLISIAMLALGHGGTDGYFDSEDFSSVSDHISFSVVGVIWLIMLIARQKQAKAGTVNAAADEARPGAHAGEPAEPGDPEAAEAGTDLESASWAWLLDPHRALVRFIGRNDELAMLLAWSEDEAAGPLRLITGPGGVGKTRLAIELSAQLADRGWDARWMSGHKGTAPTDGQLGALSRDHALLVVDNADTCVRLKPILTMLADSPADGVRILLLARSAGEWLDQLGIGSPGVRNLVSQARSAELPLSGVVDAAISDSKIANQAVLSIAREFGLRGSAETLSRTKAARLLILDLHAAALVAALPDVGLAEDGTGTVRTDIRTADAGLNGLLNHEQQYWYDRAQVRGWSEATDRASRKRLRQIIAVCWLLGAETAEEAGELVTLVPGMSPSAQLTEWLGDIFAGRHGRAGGDEYTGPSRLAELHTLRELVASSELARACLTGLTTRQALQAVTFLARAVKDFKQASSLLTMTLADVGDRHGELASPVRILTAMLSVLPSPCLPLAGSALALNQNILDLLSAQAEPAARAYWLGKLSCGLAQAGRSAAAVAAAQEAATIYGELSAADPRQFRPDHAAALDNLGLRLSECGDLVAAASAAAAAAARYRELAATDRPLYAGSLAEATGNLGFRYHDLGRSQDALSAADQAVSLYRELDAASPERYNSGFAQALTILGARCAESGRSADAVQRQEEAVALYRQLMTTSLGRYRPGLAGALDSLGNYLAKMGRNADALAPTQEAVRLYAQLAADNPAEYRSDRARALSNLSVRYIRLGQASRALPHAKTAVSIYRELVRVNADRYRPRLAISLTNLSVALKAAGHKRDADVADREAEKLRRPPLHEQS